MKRMLYVLCCLCITVGQPVVAGNFIEISKEDFSLNVKSELGELLFSCNIAYGKKRGDKVKAWDNRTPEGVFRISEIVDSSGWWHDFEDGKGIIPGAYGSWFIRLDCKEWRGIGIHGICFPESIGTNATEGCIRVLNENLVRIKDLIRVGDKVIIHKN